MREKNELFSVFHMKRKVKLRFFSCEAKNINLRFFRRQKKTLYKYKYFSLHG